MSIFLGIMLYYGSILGQEADAQVLAVFIMTLILLVSKPHTKLSRWLAPIAPLFCLIVLEIAYEKNAGFFGLRAELAGNIVTSYRRLIIPIVVVLNFIVIFQYQKSVEDLLITLRNRNNTLRKSRDENQRQKKQLQVHGEKLQEDVRIRTAELDRANQSKTIFISELSNELSAPLNAILEMTSELANPASGGRISGHQLRSIQKNSAQLKALIENVRQLSEIEEGKQTTLNLHPFELKAWLENTVYQFSNEAKLQDIEILKEMDPRFPSAVITDKQVLTEVIGHVLSSAVKFTEARKSVRVRGFMNAGKLFIQICDQSAGISMDKIPSLFRPFDQGDRDVCRKFGGSGFGLAIAKRKIELLGGDLQISSTVGEGTNFLISWPATVPKEVGA
ncbi:HAMP domain-containing sensor histidine kinase [uncultured Chitinophaga sp.]|uniref:sensor histidine kinase n=1 Tax=uncultured Chitinophaga sp. TaxID=339340 RepID=UPI0025FC8655|nr:HAMP domain-containing sensor histidine kinase [uncultured Chitinophaga sp.]